MAEKYKSPESVVGTDVDVVERPRKAVETEADIDSELDRLHSAAQDETLRVTMESLARAEGNPAKVQPIKESAELSEKAIARVTREARLAAEALMADANIDVYEYTKPPKLEILENTEEADADPDRLQTVIKKDERALEELYAKLEKEQGVAREVDTAKEKILQRRLALHKKLEEKAAVAERIETSGEQLEKVQGDLQRLEEEIKEMKPEDVKSAEELEALGHFQQEREKLRKQGHDLILSIEADNSELYVLGLALYGLDKNLAVAKMEFEEVEERAREAAEEKEAEEVEAKKPKGLERTTVWIEEKIKRLKEIGDTDVGPGMHTVAKWTLAPIGLLLASVLKIGSWGLRLVGGVLGGFDGALKWLFQKPFSKKFDFVDRMGKGDKKKKTSESKNPS